MSHGLGSATSIPATAPSADGEAPLTPQGWPPLNLRSVGSALLAVLPWWLASRVLALLGLLVSRSGWDSPGDTYIGTPFELGTYAVWDVGFFTTIAQEGYAETWKDGTPAFLPMMPMLMRHLGALIGDHPLLAGGIAANLATLVAAVSLYLLVRMGLVARRPAGHWAGVYAVAFLLMSPFGLPLFNAYSEPLLLAVALPAWIAARRNVWWLAGLLASAAVLTRVTGLSVAFGIGVLWLLSRWPAGGSSRRALSWGRWVRRLFTPSLGWVLLPLGCYLGWLAYLRSMTGRWDSIVAAQDQIWNRRVVAPWSGLLSSLEEWDSPAYGYVMRREIIATLFLGVVVALLLWKRMWPESAFAASAWLVLTSNSLWIGGGLRAVTAMFPFWMLVGVGAAALARRRNGHAWLAVALTFCGLGLFWFEMLLSQIAFIF